MENSNGANFSEVLHQYFQNNNNLLQGPHNMNNNFIIHHPHPNQDEVNQEADPLGQEGRRHQDPIILNEEDEDDEDDLEDDWVLPDVNRRRIMNRSLDLAPGGDDASYSLVMPDDEDRSDRVPSGGEGDFATYYGLPQNRERSNMYMHLRSFRQIIDRLNQRVRRDRRERRDREELGYERPAIERELDEPSDDEPVDPLEQPIQVVPILNLSQVHFVPNSFIPQPVPQMVPQPGNSQDPSDGPAHGNDYVVMVINNERRDVATQECPQPRSNQSQQTSRVEPQPEAQPQPQAQPPNRSQSIGSSHPSSHSVPSMGSVYLDPHPWPPLCACPPNWSWGQPFPLSPNLQIRPRSSRPNSSPSSSLSNESDTSSSDAYGSVLDRIGQIVRGEVNPRRSPPRHVFPNLLPRNRSGIFARSNVSRPATRSQGSRPSFRSAGLRRRMDVTRPRKKRNLFTATASMANAPSVHP